MKLFAGGYYFYEWCQHWHVPYPSPPLTHLPWKHLVAYEAPAAILDQVRQHPLLRSLGHTPPTSGALSTPQYSQPRTSN